MQARVLDRDGALADQRAHALGVVAPERPFRIADEREQPEHALLGDERRREQRRGLVADHGLSRLQRAALDALAVAHGRVEQPGGGPELAAPQLLDEHVGALVGDEQPGALRARASCMAESTTISSRPATSCVEASAAPKRCPNSCTRRRSESSSLDALLELARHVVEDRAELRELVVAAHGQPLVEVPGGDGADAVGELAQRVRERAHRERRADADEHQQQSHEQRDALADDARVGVEQVLRIQSDHRESIRCESLIPRAAAR